MASVRVKTAKKRSNSSARWLQRQLNDPYVAEAKRFGYRSRAAFKILQLDDRFKFLRPGSFVVDLGAAPGGWCQVAAKRVVRGGRGRILALDILEMDPIVDVDVMQGDFLSDEVYEALLERVSQQGAVGVDVVLSDMAAPTTGHGPTDHLRTIALCEAAWDFAEKVLAPGGAFVAKVFKGGGEREFLAALKRSFESVRHAKPPASRADSAETYVVATGFRRREELASEDE